MSMNGATYFRKCLWFIKASFPDNINQKEAVKS